MILNGDQILYRIKCGDIKITPFDESRIGTNSYDVHLGKTIKIIDNNQKISVNKFNEIKFVEVDLNKDYLLEDGKFILGSTEQYCENHSKDLVPMVEGLSSLARCGLEVHLSAGFGDIGFCGNWTLEITAKIPIILYSGMRIAQLYWLKCEPTERIYKGRYLNQKGAQEAKDKN